MTQPIASATNTPAVVWGELADREPELAAFGMRLLGARPAYLATIRPTGRPRVHLVTRSSGSGLYLFMNPHPGQGHRRTRLVLMLAPTTPGRRSSSSVVEAVAPFIEVWYRGGASYEPHPRPVRAARV